MTTVRIAADDNDIGITYPAKVWGAWLVAAAADASVLIYDALTVTGTDVMSLACLAKTTAITPTFKEGIPFKTGISVDITGAGAALYLLID